MPSHRNCPTIEMKALPGSVSSRLCVPKVCIRALTAACAVLACACESPSAPLHAPLTDLPPDLAAIRMQAEGRPTAPYTMLELRQANGFSGFVLINGRGQPVWFYRANNPFSFTQR